MFSNAQINIDSITSFDEYVLKAKECGMKAIAFTEHGNVLGWVKKKQCCEQNGLKYIHGIEAYITEDVNGEKVRDNYHCTLLAKNYAGVEEINRMSSASFNREDGHFYYVPRITFDELIKTSSNVYVLTACLGGILNKGNSELQRKFIQFLIKNKNRCFLEIQHHNVDDQISYNKKLYELHKKTGIPLIVGTDTHAIDSSQMEGRKILQKAKNVRFAEEDLWDLEFKTYGTLIEAYEKQNSLPMDVVLEAIENTNKLADAVEEFSLDMSYKYPHLWDDPEAYFKKRINEGARWRNIKAKPNYAEYKNRVLNEFKTYKHNGAIDFILLMDDIIQWCKEHDIEVGYGRGSVNGSIICYLLGITEMDSIKHKLNFERFMNTERVSLADIDTDFPPSRIDDVKKYIVNKHGLYCCDIVTFNTIALKGAIDDVCRGLYKDSEDIDYLSYASEIKNAAEADLDKAKEKYSGVFKYVDLVNGTIVSCGNHPCGMVVSPVNIAEKFGIMSTANDPYPVSQINMKEIDGLNYVKLDLLKLDTIEVINETCKMAGIERLVPDNVDIDDLNVWNSIRDNTVGIFQWEGKYAESYIGKLLSDENIRQMQSVNENVDRMTLMSIGNSAIRPAGASYRDDLANGVVRKTGAKPIDDFLSNTFGYLVFQEQIIQFLHEYCGFTMGQADIVRRCFAKKYGTEDWLPIIKNGGYAPDDKNKINHINGYIKTMKEKYGISEEKSNEDITAFIQVIEDASNYLFSLNHSQPYSYLGYVAGYLRYYYPLEFLTAALNNSDNEDKQMELIKYTKSIKIKLLAPRFRHSIGQYMYEKETNSIYKGIGSIKYMNEKIGNELYELRDNHYDSFVDLLKDLQNTTLDSRQINILIKINFFEEFGNVNTLLEIKRIFDKYDGKKIFRKNSSEIDIDMLRRYASKETAKQIKVEDTTPLIRDLVASVHEKTSIEDMLKNEIEHLGYCQTVCPGADKRDYFVLSVAKKSKIVNILLYEIFSGKTRNVKMWASQFSRYPFGDGDILHITALSKEHQKRPTGKVDPSNGRMIWENVPDKYDYWLKKVIIKKV